MARVKKKIVRRSRQLPIGVDQLAFAIERLSPDELEALELALEPGVQREVRRRQRSIARGKKLLVYSDLVSEFG